jgi:murein DD-endopeptidase MepM/ murein hydrolase activator NlpD
MKRLALLLLLLAPLLAADPHVGGKESASAVVPAPGARLIFPIAAEDYLVLTSPYGLRVSPTLRILAHHDGIDVQAVSRAQVVAAADGRVVELWPPPDGYYRGHECYGGYVVIEHGGGLETAYAHLGAVYVQGRQQVRQGQVIGRIGSTGIATGEHLHFEVRVHGEPVNPLLYVVLPEARG